MKAALFAVVASVLMTVQPAFAASVATNHCAPLIGTCAYYKCLSRDLSCATDDYPLDFGYHYCHAFDLEITSFSAKGQAFLAAVKTCLQKAIDNRPVNQCGDVLAGAPADHLKCYTQEHFCDLSFRDQAIIGETVFVTMVSQSGFRGTAERISQSCGYLP